MVSASLGPRGGDHKPARPRPRDLHDGRERHDRAVRARISRDRADRREGGLVDRAVFEDPSGVGSAAARPPRPASPARGRDPRSRGLTPPRSLPAAPRLVGVPHAPPPGGRRPAGLATDDLAVRERRHARHRTPCAAARRQGATDRHRSGERMARLGPWDSPSGRGAGTATLVPLHHLRSRVRSRATRCSRRRGGRRRYRGSRSAPPISAARAGETPGPFGPPRGTCHPRDGDRPSEARIARNRAARIACTAISRPPPGPQGLGAGAALYGPLSGPLHGSPLPERHLCIRFPQREYGRHRQQAE